ncbi:MAG: carbohydrate-binding protein [Bacteroidota bacterium]
MSFSQRLQTQGKTIIDSEGNEVILRGIGLGGWMLMEGYMMQSSDVADTQHEFKDKLIELMGEEKTNEFFDAWLANHVTKRDIDSLAAWGFNSVRLPMHYNLYTLPIEDEPVLGENTWLTTGFDLTDSLLSWCKENSIYLILDLHGAPGGQGANAAISDYDPTKPSLWESKDNRDKTVALWKKLAERYKDEDWIGGYDLINETNWTLPGNAMLLALHKEITDSIRAVGDNHIVFIEGNSWANDFTGLTPPWDDNMVYSFHKYWSFNDIGSIQWVLDMREEHDVPLWMGEGGENSNVWFTDAISLFESQGIGWSWWPMKRVETIVGPYSIKFTDGYKNILRYWRGEVAKPSEEDAFAAMMELATNSASENCDYQKDVHDAMIRQPHTDDTKPYNNHSIPGTIPMSDFDLGKNGFAYYDVDVANYSMATGSFQAWNSGWIYRNDGVDIEKNNDTDYGNGYNVGFVNKGEWLNYTVNIAETGLYDLEARIASQSSGGEFHLALDGEDITSVQSVTGTSSWTNFQTHEVKDILLEQGIHTITFHVDNNTAFNIGSIKFIKSSNTETIPFKALNAHTGKTEMSIDLVANYQFMGELPAGIENDFTVTSNGNAINVLLVDYIVENPRTIVLNLEEGLLYTNNVKVSYSGSSILSINDAPLESFTDLEVLNELDARYTLPGKLQAENYFEMSGLQTEECTDAGAGLNIGYTDTGDYADYYVNIEEEGDYNINFRVAAQSSRGSIGLYILNGEIEEEIITTQLPVTGGWQNWESHADIGYLPKGFHTLRLKVISRGFNLNWIEFENKITGIEDVDQAEIAFYPNPASDYIQVLNKDYTFYQITNIQGQLILSGNINADRRVALKSLKPGQYIVTLINDQANRSLRQKMIVR